MFSAQNIHSIQWSLKLKLCHLSEVTRERQGQNRLALNSVMQELSTKMPICWSISFLVTFHDCSLSHLLVPSFWRKEICIVMMYVCQTLYLSCSKCFIWGIHFPLFYTSQVFHAMAQVVYMLYSLAACRERNAFPT